MGEMIGEVEFYKGVLWVVGIVCSSFGTTLVALIVWNAKRLIAQQEASERNISLKLDSIEAYMQSELRQFDVRLSVVETLVLPRK